MLLSAAGSMALTSHELPADWKIEFVVVDPGEPQDVLLALQHWLADSNGESTVQKTTASVSIQVITEGVELGNT